MTVNAIGRAAENRLLRIKDVSAMTGIPAGTLRSWRHHGDMGPRSAKLGGTVVYRESEVLAWIDAQFEDSAPQAG